MAVIYKGMKFNFLHHVAMGCLFVCPQNQYVDILTPKVDVMKRWRLLRHLGHKGRDLMNVISAM